MSRDLSLTTDPHVHYAALRTPLTGTFQDTGAEFVRVFPASEAWREAKGRAALAQALMDDLIRFDWQDDPDPDTSWVDDDYTMEKLRTGALVVLGCVVYIRETCQHCGHLKLDDPPADGFEGFEQTSASLWGITVTGERDDYCRTVEVDLAMEAGVIE